MGDASLTHGTATVNVFCFDTPAPEIDVVPKLLLGAPSRDEHQESSEFIEHRLYLQLVYGRYRPLFF